MCGLGPFELEACPGDGEDGQRFVLTLAASPEEPTLHFVITRKLGEGDRGVLPGEVLEAGAANLEGLAALLVADDVGHEALARGLAVVAPAFGDRKSTRLNSSH